MPKPQIFANMSFINYPQNGMPHFMSLDFLLNHGNLDPHSETTSVSELDISFAIILKARVQSIYV